MDSGRGGGAIAAFDDAPNPRTLASASRAVSCGCEVGAAASASRAENLSWLEADMFIGPLAADDKDMDVMPEARVFIAPVFGICIDDCIIGIIELLFIVMLIKPVLPLFMGGLDVADMGANGSFCTEKSKRLEEAGLEAVGIGGAAVVVLYADASPNGSAGACAAEGMLLPKRSPVDTPALVVDGPPKSNKSAVVEGACAGAKEPNKSAVAFAVPSLAFSASASAFNSSRISSSFVFSLGFPSSVNLLAFFPLMFAILIISSMPCAAPTTALPSLLA